MPSHVYVAPPPRNSGTALAALSALVVAAASTVVPTGIVRRAPARFITDAKPACAYTSSGSISAA